MKNKHEGKYTTGKYKNKYMTGSYKYNSQ